MGTKMEAIRRKFRISASFGGIVTNCEMEKRQYPLTFSNANREHQKSQKYLWKIRMFWLTYESELDTIFLDIYSTISGIVYRSFRAQTVLNLKILFVLNQMPNYPILSRE